MEVKKEEVQQAQHSMEVSNAHKSSLGGETQRVAGHNNKKEVQGDTTASSNNQFKREGV
eukprot:CAMPEP_0201700930 /NCGR_PEP_ID=MMETSP0578-20130828/30596_1 /ASSEMBLY_ACC=CAM_ASM_000663 /TAXON_ID=267565 /ORGANISM="Skeletonema grethea, Strain CCMP 1804" /LENGTH=58 /DNA_ID=CAMNT_0048188115 /DNA_START=328 /DNA_END=504 /DNA_ORIENTATION=-